MKVLQLQRNMVIENKQLARLGEIKGVKGLEINYP